MGPLLLLLAAGMLFYLACATHRFPELLEATSLNLEPNMVVLNPTGAGSVKACVITPTNASGAPAPVHDVVWATDNVTVSILPADDGMSCKVTAMSLGTARVSVTATSKGGATLTAFADFSVEEDQEAVNLNLVVS